ncbi:MAG: ATP synthase subunit I [Nitrosomonas sp.]|nr:ATP synthase subunit I [Nitrosomonas sp.]
MALIKNVQLRTVIRWQIVYSVVIAIFLSMIAGFHGAISGFLGALVSAGAASVYAVVVSRHKGFSASGTLRTALRAEMLKILTIIFLLWAVLTHYQNVNPVIFISSFIIAVIITSMALFVPEKTTSNNDVQNNK